MTRAVTAVVLHQLVVAKCPSIAVVQHQLVAAKLLVVAVTAAVHLRSAVC